MFAQCDVNLIQKTVTQEMLADVLRYSPDSGDFIRVKDNGSGDYKGDVAGSLDVAGYIRIRVCGRKYAAHRLAWLCMTGEWPKDQIDHINHDRSDNRWANLRGVSHQENCKNTILRVNNVSGFAGVGWRKRQRKWVARIHVKNKSIFLGGFNTKEEAIKKRKTANILYGFHKNHGMV